eukprot:2807706-Pleurochrysis_carterae.AAC.1
MPSRVTKFHRPLPSPSCLQKLWLQVYPEVLDKVKDFNYSAQTDAQHVFAIVNDLLDFDKEKEQEKDRPEPDAEVPSASTPQRGRSCRKTISSPNAFSPNSRMENLYTSTKQTYSECAGVFNKRHKLFYTGWRVSPRRSGATGARATTPTTVSHPRRRSL